SRADGGKAEIPFRSCERNIDETGLAQAIGEGERVDGHKDIVDMEFTHLGGLHAVGSEEDTTGLEHPRDFGQQTILEL
ncbi:MAG: hypothetical protein ACREXS_05890, partial [Gammaproteobacteria bacterium]